MSLDSFPSPQPLIARTLRESDLWLDEGLDDCLVIDETTTYPSIAIRAQDIIKPATSHETVENIFVVKDITLYKQWIRCLRNRGFAASLRMAADYDNHEELNNKWSAKLFQKTAQFLLDIWTLVLAIYVFFYPYALKTNEELCQEFSKSMDWKNGLIRAFEWHPTSVRCALCLVNDSIYVYSADTSFVPLMKHSLQSKVSSLCWNPTREDILAVGCETAILIWTVNTRVKQYRLSSDCVRVINTRIPVPLTHLQFDYLGHCLAACGPQSSKIIVIDTTKSPEEVKSVRQWGTCFTRVLWSPDNSRLLCFTTSNHIRIYENKTWSSRKWNEMFDGLCQTAVWSRPKGHILLVAPQNALSVFALLFYDSPEVKEVGGSHVFHKALDVSAVEFPNGIRVGGHVQDMAWDKNSERLAISFKENRHYIALYKTVVKSILEITPIGFVHGLSDEIPLLISFHDAFRNGSLLTVCWSSGVVSHIPLEFDNKSNQSMYANGTPRSLTSYCVLWPNQNTPKNQTLLRSADTSLHYLSANDSVLSPKRPLLFSRLDHSRRDSPLQ